MIAFDSDVLSEIYLGHPELSQRAAAIPIQQQAIPVVVVEEIFRGRLNAIRRAESKRSKTTLVRAYELLGITFNVFRRAVILPYSPEAEARYIDWRAQRIRCGAHDLRIAAICVAFSAKLATRNRRDFEKVPGLEFEVWP